jgi:hypothetical protein
LRAEPEDACRPRGSSRRDQEAEADRPGVIESSQATKFKRAKQRKTICKVLMATHSAQWKANWTRLERKRHPGRLHTKVNTKARPQISIIAARGTQRAGNRWRGAPRRCRCQSWASGVRPTVREITPSSLAR